MRAPDGRVVLLVVSPRVAPGLLSWAAWQRLVTADAVLGAGLAPGWAEALERAGVRWQNVSDEPVAQRAKRLVEEAAPEHEVVWLGSADGDPGLTDSLAEQLGLRAVAAPPPEVELITGSHDVPGARVLDLVAVMDRLRSPGGCPWDAEQTHASLLPYLLEETHEVLEAVESGDREHLLEELGDLLLQVIFHSRVAEEDEQVPFDVDDVAGGIVAKLVRRHPHVFADVEAAGSQEVLHNWEQIKASEKQRAGLFDGIPPTLPALARAQKMLGRLQRSDSPLEAVERFTATEDAVERRLLDAVALADARGVDAESVLRQALRRLAADGNGASDANAASDGNGASDENGARSGP